MSPERFGKSTPPILSRTILVGYLVAYALIAIMGGVGITWPSEGIDIWQWIVARVSGLGAAIGALACIASFMVHRWRWEMFATLLAGVSLAGYVLIISSIAPLAARGLLLGFSTVTVLGLFVRFLHISARGLRWAKGREVGRKHDQKYGW